MAGETFQQGIIDSLSAQVALIDAAGTILVTNRAWQDFAKSNGLPGPADCLGVNYLDVCEGAYGEAAENADAAADGIRRVLAGTIEEYFCQYPCHSPREKRWFAMRAVLLKAGREKKVIITHENITPIMQVQADLELKERELIHQKTVLEETNVALKVLLRHREEDRRKMEEAILANVRESIIPPLESLRTERLSPRAVKLAELIESRIEDIISPFLQRLSGVKQLLTPQEIQVATLVREGKSTKDIAHILQISVSAAEFHRKHIRRKLGLTHTGSNLRSHLLGLEE